MIWSNITTFFIIKRTPEILTLSTTFYHVWFGCNRCSKAEMRQFCAAGTERLNNLFTLTDREYSSVRLSSVAVRPRLKIGEPHIKKLSHKSRNTIYMADILSVIKIIIRRENQEYNDTLTLMILELTLLPIKKIKRR